MAYGAIKARLDTGGVVLLDGPTGTELERRGAEMDDRAWCGRASLERPELLREIHADYIAAGCDVITANTYASSRLMLEAAGLGGRVEEANRMAVEAALAACERAAGSRPVAVAGSLSHMVPVAGGTAASDEARVPGRAAVAAAFAELADVLTRAGCDLIILEMMYHPERMRLALEAALATGLPVWAGLSARRAADGRLLSFYPHDDIAFEEIVDLVPGEGVDAAGVMHSAAELTGEALAAVARRFDGPRLAYPDSGHFEMPHWRFVDVMAPETFRAYCREWIAAGTQIVGGCCGLSLAHVEAVADLKDG